MYKNKIGEQMNQAQYPKNEAEMIIEKVKGLGKLVIPIVAVLILLVFQPWVIVGPGQRVSLCDWARYRKGTFRRASFQDSFC